MNVMNGQSISCSFFAFFMRYCTVISLATRRSFCRNVLLIRSVVCLFAGWSAESVFIEGFLCFILISAPSTVFWVSIFLYCHSVTLKKDRFEDLVVALFLQ